MDCPYCREILKLKGGKEGVVKCKSCGNSVKVKVEMEGGIPVIRVSK